MDVHSTGLIAIFAVLAAASIFGVWRRRTDGTVRTVTADTPTDFLTATDLGNGLGTRLTFVQFSSQVCRPCDVTRRVLSEAASESDGVAHVELDAETRLDLVKRFNILRTPTVLVLNPDGRVAQRISGAPKPAAVRAVIAEA